MKYIRNLDTPSPADLERADNEIFAEIARRAENSDTISLKVGSGWWSTKLSRRRREKLAARLRGEQA